MGKNSIIVENMQIPPLPITPLSAIVFTSVTTGITFILWRPSFGNQFINTYNHILNQTRGLQLIIGPNSTYPYVRSIKSLHYKFEYMTNDEGSEFLSFLLANYGLPISFVDYESQYQYGIITNPEPKLVQEDKNNLSVEFQFEKIPT